MEALVAPDRLTVNVSFDSMTTSPTMSIGSSFAVSPGANTTSLAAGM